MLRAQATQFRADWSFPCKQKNHNVVREHLRLASHQCRLLAALETDGNFEKNQPLQYKQQDEHRHLPLPKLQRCDYMHSTNPQRVPLSVPEDDPSVEQVHPLLAAHPSRCFASVVIVHASRKILKCLRIKRHANHAATGATASVS